MGYNILVTGGAGYIGSIMVPELLNQGHHVTVLDNFMYKQNSLAHLCNHTSFEVINGDIRVENIIKPLMAKADIIIPLAAYVGAPICSKDPVGASTVNKDGIKLMLKSLSKQQRVLMPTTNSAYGSGDENNFCTEESELNPISQYAIEKVEIEKALLEHGQAISFRLATVFGMSLKMRLDLLVNDFVYRAVNDSFVVLFESHFKRNYLHARDVANVFMHGIENFDLMKGEIYNVGLSDTNISKKELCERIQKYLPDFIFLEEELGKDPDQRNYVVSNEKIEKTGYKTRFSLDDGIEELIKGYRMIKQSGYSNV
jgi:nucleoside-diphosphate-sugar epimerase